jgi:pimeloyl-ACP methyl ester carboxylesterase
VVGWVVMSEPTEARVRSPDGTDLAVYAVGDGPLIVLANGLGGSWPAWGPLLRRLGPGHRIASWDYRGLYRSGPPARPDSVAIEDHVRDLGAVLEWLGGGPAVLVGWSMGVQVVVAYALDHPADVGGLVLVSGAPGDPLAGVLHTAASRWLVPPLTRVVEAGALPFGVAMRALTAPSVAPAVLRTIHVLAPNVDLDVFGALAQEFGRLDWRVYARSTRAMARHDAWPRLGTLRLPVLVVGGTADLFLPVRTIEAIAAAIPDAELCLLPGATHYLPVEFPDELAGRLERFVTERLGAPPSEA